MALSLAPGIYRVPQALAHPVQGLVRTDIAGFVGMTERGPLGEAVRLTSWEEYRRVFGGFQEFGYLPYSVRAFFENGGVECYVVRVTRQSTSRQEDALLATAAVAGDWKRKAQFGLAGAVSGGTTIPLTAALPPGAMLQFSVSGEIVTVLSVAAGTATLTAPLARAYGPGDAVNWIEGSMLASAAPVGATEITLATATAIVEGDVLVIQSPGLEQSFPARELSGLTVSFYGELASPVAAGARVVVRSALLQIDASSEGSWGNRIRVRVIPIEDAPPRVSLQVTLAPSPEGGSPQREILARLPWDDHLPQTVKQMSNLIRVRKTAQTLSTKTVDCQLAGGSDGLDGLTEMDYIGDSGEEDHSKFYGLRLLEDATDVAIVALPDAVYLRPLINHPQKPPVDPCGPPVVDDDSVQPSPAPAVKYTPERILTALLEHCQKMRYRVGVLDVPIGFAERQAKDWVEHTFPRAGSLAKWGAIYFPWLNVPSPLADSRIRVITVPASGHVAGLYARIDRQTGVQHPPANGALSFASAAVLDIEDNANAELNESGVNVIRWFPGRGIRVWGARSLSHQEGVEDPWQYIHARRLMSYIERSVELAMQWTVFEPNDFALQRTLVHMLTEFLTGIWRTGGLQGVRPEEGFYVKCDSSNNPQSVIDAGQIVCEVGVAIPAPMEFLKFEIRLGAGSVQVKEASA